MLCWRWKGFGASENDSHAPTYPASCSHDIWSIWVYGQKWSPRYWFRNIMSRGGDQALSCWRWSLPCCFAIEVHTLNTFCALLPFNASKFCQGGGTLIHREREDSNLSSWGVSLHMFSLMPRDFMGSKVNVENPLGFSLSLPNNPAGGTSYL